MDGQVELFGQCDDPAEAAVADRVRRVRCQAEVDQRLLQPALANGQALAQVVVGIAGVGGGEFEGGDAQGRAHAQFAGCLGAGVGIEIHVVEAGDAAAQHFGAGQAGAVEDELRRHVCRLGRPDVLLQPLHQWQVVGDAAQQAHRCVGVEIDQAGDQQMLAQDPMFRRLEAVAGFAGREQGDDTPLVDGDGVVFEQVVGVDRSDPAGFDQQVDVGRGACHGVALKMEPGPCVVPGA